MIIAQVYFHVKPDHIEAFKVATVEHARNSLQEPGVVQFSVTQETGDPRRFLLFEVYRTPDDPIQHMETAHYLSWRKEVADMLAEPKTGITYRNIFPDDAEWGK